VTIALIVYGDIRRRSGGYLYDREVVRLLEQHGHTVRVVSLEPRTLLHGIAGRGRTETVAALRSVSGFDWIVIDELVHPAIFPVRSLLRRLPPRKAALVHHLAVSEALPLHVSLLHRLAEQALLRRVDLLVATSGSTAAVIRTLVKDIDTVVCRPGVDRTSTGTRPRTDVTVRLLSTGNLIPRKGHHLLLEAMARAESDAPLNLLIAGDSSVDSGHAVRVEQRAAGQGPGKRATVSGYLTRDRLVEAYRDSDLFLSASQHEGYGISLAEALSFNLPFIAFDTASFREIAPSAVVVSDERELATACRTALGAARHGSPERDFSGILVPYPDVALMGSAISRVASDPALRARMSDAAHRDAEGLGSWADTGACFEAALESARGGPHGG